MKVIAVYLVQNISATGVHADWLAVKSPELPNVSWGVPLLHCHGVGWRSGGDHLFSSTLIILSSFFLCSINNLYPNIELAPLYHWCAVLTKSLVETRFCSDVRNCTPENTTISSTRRVLIAAILLKWSFHMSHKISFLMF